MKHVVISRVVVIAGLLALAVAANRPRGHYHFIAYWQLGFRRCSYGWRGFIGVVSRINSLTPAGPACPRGDHDCGYRRPDGQLKDQQSGRSFRCFSRGSCAD